MASYCCPVGDFGPSVVRMKSRLDLAAEAAKNVAVRSWSVVLLPLAERWLPSCRLVLAPDLLLLPPCV